jgi:predicted metal-dependent hydrolase
MPGLLRRLGFELREVEPLEICISERKLGIILRRNALAKRLILRMSKCGSHVIVTMPKRASAASARAFVEKSRNWIEGQLAKRKPREDGIVPIRGVPHRIEATGGRRGLIGIEADKIHVPGDAAHAERRLRDWLKALARKELSEASLRYAAAMGTTVKAISVRDQASRWGSCAADGKLSYSWRLIMAPAFVLDYVAAHEVAHRLEMNHGPRFWRLVLTHCPHTKDAKNWLKAHGRELHEVLA